MFPEQRKEVVSRASQQDRSPVSLVVDYDGAEDLILDYEENLSSGTVFFNTSRRPEVGTHVQLTLTFPGLLAPIGIGGVVRWTRDGDEDEQGIGVELEDGARRDHLSALIERVRERDPSLVSRLVRILVIEDNPHVAQLIRNGLHGSGKREFHDLAFNFRTVDNGRDALELLHSESFDALIVDVYLPILDGAHVIERVRADERLRGLPVIAVSAGGKSAQDAAMAAGADIFLEKPMRLRQIVDAMRSLVDLDS